MFLKNLATVVGALWLPSTALAQLQVSVMPSYSQNSSYANAEINQPIQVWGRAWGGTAPYTYTLNFGDATPDAGGAAGNPNDIGTVHTYNTAGVKTFTLTVSDATSASVSRSGAIRVYSAPTQDQRVNMAIEKALRYLYLSQNQIGADQSLWQAYPVGSNGRNEYTIGSTGATVLAFEENGHLPGNDPVADVYAPTVQRGLNWLTHFAQNQAISPQTYGNPDSNGNGVGTYLWAGGHETYANSFATLALIASEQTAAGAQARTIPTGPLAGKSYYDTVQDIIDLFNYSQSDGAGNGGWEYNIRTSNSGSLDGSSMQWPALISRAAEDLWGITTPSWVTSRTAAGFKVLQNANGAIGYRANNQWLNSGKTGGALVAWQVAGLTPDNDAAVASGLDFIEATFHVNSTGSSDAPSTGAFGQWYGMYGLKKGLQLQEISSLQTPIGSRDWQADYDSWLLGEAAGLAASTATSYRNVNSMFGQRPDGSWASTNQWPGTYVSDPDISTAHGVLILTRSVTVALPAAVIAEVGQVSTKPGQRAFQMDGTGSFHSDPSLSILEYRWDFDASNGVDFDNPDAVGAIVSNPGYTTSGNYTVTLQVRDNSNPQRIGQSTELVQAVDTDVAPNARAIPAGLTSYNAKPGDTVTFNGSDSSDPDGDPITLYEWDLDGDGQFDDATGATPQIVAGPVGSAAIRLRVTALGKTGVSPEVPFVISRNDLSVAALTASDIVPGVSADIVVQIGNDPASGNAFNDVLVRFYDGDPLAGGAQIGGNFLVNVPVGGTVSLTANNLPLGGAQIVHVYIDANGQIAEYNESNNIDSVNATNSPPLAVARSFTIPANENCQGQATAADFDGGSSDPDGDPLTFSVAPPGPYPLGTTSVILTVTDDQGASDTDTAAITVIDTTPPLITLVGLSPQVVECGSPYVEAGATAADVCDGNLSAAIVINSSTVDTSTAGSYIVTYDVSDLAGNDAVTVFRTVQVVDTTPPLITLVGLSPQVVECGSPYVEAGATAADICDGNLSAAIVINSSTVDTSTPGSYIVTYDVSDLAGNAAVSVFRSVRVVDTTPPVLALNGPANITLECGIDAYVELGATASDVCDPSVVVVIGGDPVDSHMTGAYVVSYSATDASGNVAIPISRTVTVMDTTPPVIACPGDMQVPTTGPQGAIVNFTVTATDACDPSPLIVCTPASGSRFPVGETVVTCRAIDAAGLEDTCSFVIKVLSAEFLLCDLIEYVRAMPIHHGIKNAFLAKLLNSKSSLQRGRTNAAVNQLSAFINHVAEQSGDKLTIAQADDLTARAAVVYKAITGVGLGAPYLVTIDFGLGFEKYAGAGVMENRLTIFPSQVDGLEGSGTLLQLVWDGTGVLESATGLTGPWTRIEFAEPPYWHAVMPDEPKRFFRVNRP